MLDFEEPLLLCYHVIGKIDFVFLPEEPLSTIEQILLLVVYALFCRHRK
jgi:hypothetical protein